MKGSMKQIQWAEDIRANAINTCTANIERMSAEPLFALDVKVYKIFRAGLIARFDKIDDAALIIKQKELVDPRSIIDQVSRATEMIRDGKMTIEKLVQMSGVSEY